MTIKDSAIFISDSHYNSERKTMFELLKKIEKKEITTIQIFLMGDIFDFLCDEIDYFQEVNDDLIELINSLSETIEINYFEGNHDFSLEDTFSKINVIQRQRQPIHINLNNKKLALAHGDIFTPKSYDIFSAIFRNPYFLNFLNFIDLFNIFSKFAEKKLKKKNICKTQENFKNFVEKRIKSYNVDFIIEGHFHQGYLTQNYINLPSLACQCEYMQYQNGEFKFIKV